VALDLVPSWSINFTRWSGRVERTRTRKPRGIDDGSTDRTIAGTFAAGLTDCVEVLATKQTRWEYQGFSSASLGTRRIQDFLSKLASRLP